MSSSPWIVRPVRRRDIDDPAEEQRGEGLAPGELDDDVAGHSSPREVATVPGEGETHGGIQVRARNLAHEQDDRQDHQPRRSHRRGPRDRARGRPGPSFHRQRPPARGRTSRAAPRRGVATPVAGSSKSSIGSITSDSNHSSMRAPAPVPECRRSCMLVSLTCPHRRPRERQGSVHHTVDPTRGLVDSSRCWMSER